MHCGNPQCIFIMSRVYFHIAVFYPAELAQYLVENEREYGRQNEAYEREPNPMKSSYLAGISVFGGKPAESFGTAFMPRGVHRHPPFVDMPVERIVKRRARDIFFIVVMCHFSIPLALHIISSLSEGAQAVDKLSKR